MGRRKHSRYLLPQPIDCLLRLRDEVAIEKLGAREVVVLSQEACRPDDRVALEIPGNIRRRINARVAGSRPVAVQDGAIRHRLRLVLQGTGSDGESLPGGSK